MTFFNTTHEQGEQLDMFVQHANSQDEKILRYFQTNKKMFSPSQVWKHVFDRSIPITSVRRAMTSLANDGKLIKTNHKIAGPFGRPEYLWGIAGQRGLG